MSTLNILKLDGLVVVGKAGASTIMVNILQCDYQVVVSSYELSPTKVRMKRLLTCPLETEFKNT